MNQIPFEKINGPRSTLAVIAGTALGAGFVPRAPGTMGTLVGIPVAYLSAEWNWPVRLLLWIGLTVVGTWAAQVIDEITGKAYNQAIVIDEVIGLGVTAWTAGRHWPTLFAAFLLFRFFDIVKPFPVRRIDRWSKTKALGGTDAAKWWGGFGVMADDIVAGLQGLLVVLILQAIYSGVYRA